MAYDLAIGRNSHDLVFDPTGDLILIDNAERVLQQIKIALLFRLGEWFQDITLGVPYIEEILVKNPDISTIQSILRAVIADIPGVDQVITLSLELDRQARNLTVNFAASTDYGVVNNSVSLDG